MRKKPRNKLMNIKTYLKRCEDLVIPIATSYDDAKPAKKRRRSGPRKPYKPREIDRNASIYVCIIPGTSILMHWRGYRSFTKARKACPSTGVVTSLAWAQRLRKAGFGA
jgi:hypothetical protein